MRTWTIAAVMSLSARWTVASALAATLLLRRRRRLPPGTLGLALLVASCVAGEADPVLVAPGWTATLDDGSATVAAADASYVVRLTGFGRGAASPVSAATPQVGECLARPASAAVPCENPVALVRDGLVEGWEEREDGLEHHFTVEAPPAGVGPLVFELGVDDAEVFAVASTAAAFTTASGARWYYRDLAAWDETGRPLPATMDLAPGGLRISVDDTGATGAVTVDPLLTQIWSVEGEEIGLGYAETLASADVNGDGFDDVLTLAPFFSGKPAGQLYVYHGSPIGPSVTPDTTVDGTVGVVLASAGDVNGDGFEDIAVSGGARLFLGGAGGLATTPSWVTSGDFFSCAPYTVGTAYGAALSSAGDVDGDGYDDLILSDKVHCSSPALFVNDGRVYLYRGGPSGLETEESWVADGGEDSAQFGASVANAGDVDGDGFDDVLVGAPTADGLVPGGGEISMFRGSSTGLEQTASWTFSVPDINTGLGLEHSLSSAGDVNGDGFDDVLVAARTYNGGSVAEGRVWCFHGSATGLSAIPTWVAEPDEERAYFGSAVTALGDINADGYDDVMIGAPSAKSPGMVYVYLGSASGLEGSPAWTASGTVDLDGYGTTLAGGDLDGDGYDEALVGAPFTDGIFPAPEVGKVYAYGCYSDGDTDGDTIGDVCDACPGFDDFADIDADGVADGCDVCPDDADPGQEDTDADALGDVCDPCPLGDVDADGDGSCSFTDCDDLDVLTYPGAPEQCDGRDNACAGSLPANELDGDGDGDPTCSDCDDADPTRFTGAPELCNGVDDGCQGGVPLDEYDTDGDGLRGCAADCDNRDATVYPGAPQLCDGQDNTCSGVLPPDEVDGDGDGTPACADCDDNDPTTHPGAVELCDGRPNTCAGPAGPDEVDADADGVLKCAGDCDDADPFAYPGAPERCDGRDNTCAGSVPADEADDDTDGAVACADCDDADPTSFPGAPELCDGRDNTCAGSVPSDEGDADADGASTCAGDCDDTDPQASPGQQERCADRVDNNCDGAVDEGCPAPPVAEPDQTCGCAGGGSNAWSAASALAALVLLRRRGR